MVFLARDFRAVLLPRVQPDTAAVGILQDEHESERRHDLAGMGDAQRIEMPDPRPERFAIGYVERDRIETPRCLRMLFAQAKIELGAEPGDVADIGVDPPVRIAVVGGRHALCAEHGLVEGKGAIRICHCELQVMDAFDSRRLRRRSGLSHTQPPSRLVSLRVPLATSPYAAADIRWAMSRNDAGTCA